MDSRRMYRAELERLVMIYNHEVMESLLNCWVELLRGFPLDRVRGGINQWLKSGGDFPGIQDLLLTINRG